ncbi:MAG: hypothetical protein ABR508_11360 [Candidatus Baltobacteraceae bacterium]
MARILLQTTIPYVEDGWHAGRFSALAKLLEADGHDVTARNREPDARGSDPVLTRLAATGFDELWLMAVDAGNGLAPSDVRGILTFREKGRGVLTARDHQNTGASILNLGAIGSVNNFNKYNRERDIRRLRRDDHDNALITYPNYHSGNNGDYQRIVALEPVHEVLRTRHSPSGVVEYFPAHPHEGALSVPEGMSFARVIATSLSTQTGRSFNLAVAIDNEPSMNGHACGRAIALSTFQHLTDYNWGESDSAPSFVTEPRGTQFRDDPQRMETYKDYIRNLARWLSPPDF